MSVFRNLSGKALARGLAGVVVFLSVWQFFARSGLFSQALTPPLEIVLRTLGGQIADGTMAKHLAATVSRVLIGLSISFIIALPVGMLMGKYRLCERFFIPFVSVLMPIPSLAWVPLVVLWFGIGNLAMILVVVYAASFPLIYNVWTGVRTVNPLWLRAAAVMGAGRGALFGKVIWPAALPHVIIGLRLAFGRAWIAVIGGELLASPDWGLGKLIFEAREFLSADVMLSALIVIGLLGLFFERIVFQTLETVTVVRWGMVAPGR